MAEGNRTARTAILDRIRTANRSVDAAAYRTEYQTIAREYRQSASMDRAAILKMFAERLREYDAQVHVATSRDLRDKVREVLAAHGQKSVIVANGFPLQFVPDGLSCQAEADADTEALNQAEGAIVTCEVAIAHTGTIILRDSRKATLLPDRLLCIVLEDQVVETVPEAFARLQLLAADALTFISGPSATADIEMSRICGVHGPRFLEVVLVQRDFWAVADSKNWSRQMDRRGSSDF